MEAISVIVACFNQRRYIEQCIDSILTQTYPDIEAIVVDDGSTDGTREYLKSVTARHRQIKAVFNKCRLGVSAVRIRGVDASRGALLTTLDADDYFVCNQKIEVEAGLLQATEKGIAQPIVVYSTTVMVDERGDRIPAQQLDPAGKALGYKCFLKRSCYIPRDMLFRRSTYQATGGFDPTIKIFEDWDLKIRLAKRAKFIWSGIEGVAYRRHGHGLSNVRLNERLRWRMAVLNKNLSTESTAFAISCRLGVLKWYLENSAMALVRNLR